MAQAGRWLAIMEEFDFTVQHRAGSIHQNADALSRRPVAEVESHVDETSCLDPESNDVLVRAMRRPCATGNSNYHPGRTNTCNEPEDETKFTGVPKLWHVHSSGEMAELQRNDPDICPIFELRLQSEEQPSFDMIRDRSVNMKHYWSQWPRLVVSEGVVYRTAFN